MNSSEQTVSATDRAACCHIGDVVDLSTEGTVRETTIPDTLDLADRAALSLNALGGCIDPDLLTMYGMIHFCAARPHQSHWASAETLCDPKFAESFPLMRLMSGSHLYADLERQYCESILSRVDDGLYWDRVNPRRPWRNNYGTAFYGEGRDEDFCTLPGAGRLLRTLLVWRELGAGSGCDRLLDDLCAGLRRILIVQGDYGYYPEKGGWGEPCAYPRSGWLNTDEAKSDTDGAEGAVTAMHGHQLYGAAHWHEISGSPVALDLAAKLANYCLLPRFWGGVPDLEGDRSGLIGHVARNRPDPPFVAGRELGHWYSHFHARAIALRGLLAYAHVTDNQRIIEFVRRSYEFTLSQGIPRMGWINCFPATLNRMEGCALGDVIGLAIRLSDIGAGDYWDDVDAVVRNQLMEQQLTRAEDLRRVATRFSDQPDHTLKDEKSGMFCFDDVFERSLGSFGGTALPTSLPQPSVMHCCTGNATQGLYYAWEGALRECGEEAVVNLLLNRAGRLVDIDSHLPYEGKVVVRNKSAARIAVRIPVWVERRSLHFDVAGQAVQPRRVGRYLIFDSPPAGVAISLTFPVKTGTATYTVNAQSPQEQQYTCEFRGSTLVDISPRDESPDSYPLYLREQMKGTVAPMRRAKRFIAARTVLGW